tara:strand:- start:545 stop:1303 length:759 start_codon:yes stop_codon:yes gene_type:complete
MSQLNKLINIVKKLRAPDGCEWDKEQTSESLVPYLLEETYEVIEAIEQNDYIALKEELGDLLLHVVFQAELLSENKDYTINESIDNVVNKLIKRHPHIFNDNKTTNRSKGEWELTKQKEKNRESVLEGVPISFPALLRARRIQEKAAGVGFDWDDKKHVISKIDEEIKELKDAINIGEGINEELGDVLFTIVNLSRHLNLNPERSLRLSIEKFSNRFKKIEKELKIKKINMKDLSLEELDKIWNKNKELSNE